MTAINVQSELGMLTMEMLKPDDGSVSDLRPCIIFYFGGGFVKRNLKHFKRQAEYFRNLGVICILADYHLANEGDGLAVCFADAQAVLNEVAEKAEQLGIDRHKIVVCGGSAGGTLACWCSLNSSIPCAQVLFNPVLFFGEQNIKKISPKEIMVQINEEAAGLNKVETYMQAWGEEFKLYPQHFSAYHKLDNAVIPPTLILQGSNDPIAYSGVILFHQKALESGNDCQLVLYQGEEHGFFNYDKNDNKFCYEDTLKQMEAFLRERNLI